MTKKQTKRQSIWIKVILGLLLASAIPTALLSITQYQQLKGITLTLQLSRIDEIADMKALRLRTFLQQKKEAILQAESDPVLIESFAHISRNIDKENSTYERAKNRIDSHWKTWTVLQNDLVDVLLIDTNKQIVYSSIPSRQVSHVRTKVTGLLEKAYERGIDTIALSSVYRSNEQDAEHVYRMLLSAPIISKQGSLLGVMVFELNMDLAIALMQETTEIGTSAHVTVIQQVDDSVEYLSIIPGEHSTNQLHTFLQTHAGTLVQEEHILAWRSIPSLSWSVIVQLDKNEILAPLRAEMRYQLLLSVVVIAGIMFMGYIYSRSMTRRIELLTKAAEQIANGKESIQASEEGNDEITVLSKALNTMTKELALRNKEEREKKDLLSVGAHQLRSPLNKVLWGLQTLQKQQDKLSKKDTTLLVAQSTTAARKMRQIMRTILTLTSIERNNLQPRIETVALHPFIQDIESNYTQECSEKKQTINIACPKTLSLRTDKNLLGQALDNLVGNAVKYTPKKGTITIRARKEGKKNIVIEVQDTGYGIPRDQEQSIFTKYFRADNAEHKNIQGTGLGLYLVKILLTIIQGEIYFTSSENKGTTFTVRLPSSPSS